MDAAIQKRYPDPCIPDVESAIPLMAAIAFKAAQAEAFAAGESVWFSGDGVIYERFPDGTRIDHKKVKPPTRVVPGTRYRMR